MNFVTILGWFLLLIISIVMLGGLLSMKSRRQINDRDLIAMSTLLVSFYMVFTSIS